MGPDAHFLLPFGVAVDRQGVVYVADAGSGAVRRIDPATHAVTTIAGGDGVTANGLGYHNGSGAAVRFFYPEGLAVDRRGDLYVADTGNGAIRKIDHDSHEVSTLAGGDDAAPNGQGVLEDGTGAGAHFGAVAFLALDGTGRLYAADFTNNAIRTIDPATGEVGTLVTSAPSYQDGSGGIALSTPYGLAADGSGNLFFADAGNHAIRRLH